MKSILIAAIALSAMAGSANAQLYNSNRGSSYGSSNNSYGTGSNPNSHYVSPYTQRDGSSSPGHYQTNPNNTTLDNYGTRGNYNPYSGQTGKRSPY